jgi:biotin carboxyl carrier protein
MEHTVTAPHAGSVDAVLVAEGRAVSTGEVLVVVSPAGDGHAPA